MSAAALNSCLYVGQVRHQRYVPKPHAFRYRLFMMLLDLDELEEVFRGRWLWSVGRRNLAWFRRADYLDGASTPLGQAVRDLVRARTGRVVAGPVRMLTHLRLFGTCFNPISLYFCYGAAGQSVEAVVAEVTNTPWHERRCYVLDAPVGETLRGAAGPGLGAGPLHYRFEKALHVSPFLDMDYLYDMQLTEPGKTLAVHLENLRLSGGRRSGAGVPGQLAAVAGEKVHDATLTLERRPLTGVHLAGVLAAYPFMTARVIAAIHFEALRLWAKGIPYVPHQGVPAGTAGQ